MKVVELPCDVMDASEDIQFIVVIVKSVPVSIVGNHALIFHRVILEISQTELPEVVKSGGLALSSKKVYILVVSSDG